MKPRLMLLALFAAAALLAPRLHAQTTVQVATGADGTGVTQQPVSLAVGQTFTVNSSGAPVAVTIPTMPVYRSGIATGTAGLTRTVTFTHAMPDALYGVTLTGANGIGALQLTYSNVTTTGFTINFSLSTSAAVSWRADEPNL